MATERRKAGDQGELIAREYLEGQGLKFLTANWSCKTGEVDLIMRDSPPNRRASVPDGTLVFVEVRLRRPTDYGEGFETVGQDKQRKLILTAQYYQQKENYWGDIRFDVVSILAYENGQHKIDHVEHAFEAWS